jgi:mitochondrial import inner membrane translocase subunit TIM50
MFCKRTIKAIGDSATSNAQICSVARASSLFEKSVSCDADADSAYRGSFQDGKFPMTKTNLNVDFLVRQRKRRNLWNGNGKRRESQIVKESLRMKRIIGVSRSSSSSSRSSNIQFSTRSEGDDGRSKNESNTATSKDDDKEKEAEKARKFLLEEEEEEEEDPNNPMKPKGPIGQAVDFMSAIALMCATAVAAVVGASYYMQTTKELEKTVEEKDFGQVLNNVPFVNEFSKNLLMFRKFIDEKSSPYLDPISDKLLPDHPSDAQYIPHTLVLDLDDTLINSNWNRERGWRVFKRPGVDAFLEHLAQFYEMAVFTDQLETYGNPIVERLDPKRYVSYRLFRESAQYKHGEYVRDLSKLNRDMNRVIYLSSKPKSAEMNPENVIPIQPWRYEDGSTDTALLDLMPFLESIVRLGVADVRAVLVSYKEEMSRTGKDIPQIFRERQQKFQKNRLEKQKQLTPMSRSAKKIERW